MHIDGAQRLRRRSVPWFPHSLVSAAHVERHVYPMSFQRRRSRKVKIKVKGHMIPVTPAVLLVVHLHLASGTSQTLTSSRWAGGRCRSSSQAMHGIWISDEGSAARIIAVFARCALQCPKWGSLMTATPPPPPAPRCPIVLLSPSLTLAYPLTRPLKSYIQRHRKVKKCQQIAIVR